MRMKRTIDPQIYVAGGRKVRDPIKKVVGQWDGNTRERLTLKNTVEGESIGGRLGGRRRKNVGKRKRETRFPGGRGGKNFGVWEGQMKGR